MAGSPDERAIVIESGGCPRLDARYAEGTRAAAVVAPPHPAMGGRMDNPVVETLVAGLHAAGIATLRFDWRGAGQSKGEITGDPDAAKADFGAALAQLTVLHAGPYVATGYSFGAATALTVAASDPRVTRLVLVAPPVGLLRTELLGAFAGDGVVLVGDQDHYAPLVRLQPILAPFARLRLEVIEGADHFFATGVERIAALVAGL